MLHTRVRCRARVWDVLDVRSDADVTTWYLLRDSDTPRLVASPPDHVQPLPARTRAVSRRAWTRHVVAWARECTPVWWPSRAGRLPITAVAWQLVPSMLVLSGHHRRLLIADEVGMGKTVQAAVLLHEVHARDVTASTLVVVPAGLLAQWRHELLAKARIDAAVLDATALRREASRPWREVDASRVGGCWLVSMDMLRQPDVVSLLARTSWTLLVVDEAHMAAPGTARLAAVQRVATASMRLLLLTATPNAGGLQGVTSLRAIGQRAGEHPMAVLRRPAAWLERMPRRTHVLQVRLDLAHAALCARLDRFAHRARHEIGPAGLLPALVLRRRAASCPAAVVRSLERRLEVLGTAGSAPVDRGPGLFDLACDQDDDDAETMRMPAWQDERSERAELAALLAHARHLAAAGRKIEAVARLLRRVDEPAVVFTAYVDTLRALRHALQGRRVVVVHGSQPGALRADALAAFTQGDADVLVTTDASAEGLNLHARCRLVVHAEVPPSARVLEQRTGRVDRYGQPRRVHAIVMASDTVEDCDALARIARRAQDDAAWPGHTRGACRRSALASRVLAARGATPPPMTRRPAARPPGIAVARCEVAPGRWRRLSERWQLPLGARGVWAGTIAITSDAPLSTSRLHAMLAVCGTGPVDSAESLCRLLSAPVARATRLARRMHTWARAASVAASRERSQDRDLFGVEEPPPILEARRMTSWTHVRTDALIARRGFTAAADWLAADAPPRNVP